LSSPSYIINDPITVGTFNWRIYVPQSTITQSTIQTGYGLNVYKTDGTVAFTSNRAAQLMRVRGIFPAKGYWDEVNNMPYGSGAGDVRFKSAFENNLGATGTRQQYPFVQMNATTSSLAGYFDGSGYSNSYSIMVGGKTNAAGNTIVHSVLSDGTFDAGTGDVATYGLSTPCQLLPANYTYNSSTGILKYTPIFSWMGQLRDFQVGVPFTFTTGFNAQGFPYVTNVLVANSVTRTSGTTNNIDLNIGTGLTIDPANPSVTSWSNVSTFRRSAREPLSNYYGPGNTLQTNIVNTFGTTTMVLDE
jgi:hypothetical protein